MGIALTEDQLAFAGSVRAFVAKNAPTTATRLEFESLAAGTLTSSWNDMATQGLLGVHLPEQFGGGGGELIDLAVLLEEAARGVMPGPLLPSVIASALLDRFGSAALREQLLPQFVGGATAAVSTTPDDLRATRSTAGGWEISGTTLPVLGALSAQWVVLCASGPEGPLWFVANSADDSIRTERCESVDLTRDLALLTVLALQVPETHVLTGTAGQIRSLIATLVCAEAAGVARWCQESGLAYAKVREQFGRPIGAFQAIKHKCARLFGEVELMAGAAWDAASAADRGDEQAHFAALAAAVLCLPAAVQISVDTVTLFGGIGYTWEHDAHLYWRRAISLSGLLGERQVDAQELGALARSVTRVRELDLNVGAEREVLRQSTAAKLAEIGALPETQQRAAIAAAGLFAPHYPQPYGLGADPLSQIVISEELARAGLTQPSMVIGEWVVPTLIAHGTDAQRERFVMSSLVGEISWCQLFSEPGAGSDLASLRTRAERTERGWLINGQKVWTSKAQEANWAICLARTDPDVPKHKGISYFLVAMDSPGVEVRPLREANGTYMFNEVFLDDVFVPDELMVGEPNDGWRLARTTMGNERVTIGSGMSQEPETAAKVATRVNATGAVVDVEVGRWTARSNGLEALTRRALLRQLDGLQPGPEASILKVLSAQQTADLWLMAVGWAGQSGGALSGTPTDQTQLLLSTPATLVGGGTAEIQLNVVAEHVLGLPRG